VKDTILGFGTSDGMMGIFDLSSPSKSVSYFDRRMKGCVYAVSFGPSVSFLDSNGPTKVLGLVPNKDEIEEKKEEKWKKGVGGTGDEKFLLYGCGGDSICALNPSKVSNPLINVSKIIETTNRSIKKKYPGTDRATDIRWSPDHKIFAVGYNNG